MMIRSSSTGPPNVYKVKSICLYSIALSITHNLTKINYTIVLILTILYLYTNFLTQIVHQISPKIIQCNTF